MFGLMQGTHQGGVALLDGSESDGTQILTNNNIGLTSGWTVDLATLTASATTAPDGNTTAASLVDTNSSARHIVYQAPPIASLSDNTPYTLSIYSKQKNVARYLNMKIQGAGSEQIYAYFDPVTGTITDSGTVSPGANTALISVSIAAAVNGFYKCSLRFKTNSGISSNGYWVLQLSTRSTYALDLAAGLTSGSPTYTGDGSSGLYFWRPKMTT